MKKQILLILPLLSCVVQSGWTQPANIGWEKSHLPQFYTPQVADMMRYDRTSAPLSSGMADLSIPLVEFDDPDFDFPIGIRYVSDGFKPSKADNFVGHDWILQCGGVVYREINGIADDLDRKFIQMENGQSQYVGGFLHMVHSCKGVLDRRTVEQEIVQDPYKYSKVYNSDLIPLIPKIRETQGRNVESFPDLYHFSFGGYSGTFVINFDGTVTAMCENGGKVKVNLNDYSMLGDGTRNLTQRIWISTDDGYQYCFGGCYGAVEYTAKSWRETSPENYASWSRQCPQITAYHLTRIIAPNGRTLDIEYLDKIPGEYHSGETDISFQKSGNPLYAKGAQVNYSFSCQVTALNQVTANMNSQPARDGAVTYPTFILNKTALISGIMTDTQRFTFKYSETDAASKPGFSGDFFTACGAKLDAIEYYKGNLRQQVKFTYEYAEGGSRRLFLKSVRTPREGVYSFKYNLQNYRLPEYVSRDLDHSGYWRGPSGTNTKLIPGYSKSAGFSSLTIDSECRNPTGAGQDCAMLKEVTFPTGGRVEFEYQPHRYHRWLEQEMGSDNRMFRSLKTATASEGLLAGGVRLSSRKYYDNGKVVKYIRYKYESEDGTCSGILYDKPLYYYLIFGQSYMSAGIPVSDLSFINFKSDGYKFDQSDVDKQHVQYSEVTEQFVDNYTDDGTVGSGPLTGPYTVYKFLDYILNPDISVASQTKFFSTSGLSIVPVGYPVWFYNCSLICDSQESHSNERGKLWNESHYSSSGALKKSITNRFERIYGGNYLVLQNTFGNLADNQTQTATAICNRRLYSYVPSLVVTSVCEEGNDEMTDSLQYVYDSKGYLKTKIHKRPSKDILSTSYTYAHECSGEPYASMAANHLSPLVEEQNIYTDIDHNTSLLPSFRYNYEYNYPVPSNGVLLSNNAVVESVVRCDTDDETVRIPEHDTYGNPLYTIENESTHTVYLWSYSGKYPVAKIENATYGQVCGVLSISPDDLSRMDEPDMGYIDRLREALPDAQVSTYTYKQNLGVASATDPSGITTWYEYDEAGRLSEVYQLIRGVKTVLQGNKYHIVNY